MCGIAGTVGFHNDKATLQKMADVLAHRGPDESAIWTSDDAGLAFSRLSIIDVAGGHQPIWNETGDVAILLNGEIYNHHELQQDLEARGHRFRTRSDAEVVVHLWEDHGRECLQPLRGMFAFAIWDARTRTLFLARDRVGKKPLYYQHRADGALLFGSEIKAILQCPGVAREPDLQAINYYLTLQYVPTPLTAFKGIARVPPAHWLEWRNGQVTIERYWQLNYKPKTNRPERELVEELRDLVDTAVRLRLESEVPLGAFLSGGLDSSIVVACAAGAMSQPLKTFTIGFSSTAHDERQYADMVARHFGTDHTDLEVEAAPDLLDDMIWHYDQPFGDSSAVPSFAVARMTRQFVTVALNGDGGDEDFAGYGRYDLMKVAPFFQIPRLVRAAGLRAISMARPLIGRKARVVDDQPADFAELYFNAVSSLDNRTRHSLFDRELSQAACGAVYGPLENMRAARDLGPIDAMVSTDVQTYLPDDLLVKMDVATMAHSLEARSPFLDHKVMEFAAALPAHMKIRNGNRKYLLKTAFADRLPAAIVKRPKMGFGVPLNTWLRTTVRERLLDSILSDRARGRGYFKPDASRQMVDSFMGGNDNHTNLLWYMLMLEVWHQRFIDARPEAA
jgi:asparagine synthase (glutamine-hydrolysing)